MRIPKLTVAVAVIMLGIVAQNAGAQQQLILLAGEHTVDPVLASGHETTLTVGQFATPPSEPLQKFFVLAERGVFMHPSIEGMAQEPAGGAVAASASEAAGGAVTTTVTESTEWTSYGAHAMTLVTADGNYECYGAKVTESPPLDPNTLGDAGAGLTDPRMYGLECLQWNAPSD